jgi:flavin-dependent thymidylate synthase
MKVYLAGYNLDSTVIKELEGQGKRADITPEVISAAYARISRDPRTISEIRKQARQEVETSRKSNQTIIFKMGHHSVAEHAVFNLDVIGLSRYAMEELEKFRLCSYTEKSQRYITLDKDYVVPEEIRATAWEAKFTELIARQNNTYFALLEKLKTYVFEKNADLAADPKKHNLLEGWAKEDARYISALATQSQVGLTINARNLELMLRRFASHQLQEVRQLGKEIYRQIAKIAPSIVIFHQANDRDLKTYRELAELTAKIIKPPTNDKVDKLITIDDYSKKGDDLIAAALLHSSTLVSLKQCSAIVKKMPEAKKVDIFKAAFRHLQFYDSLPREFEYANLTYNIVLSAACFGQLKRHRMATLTTQAYDPRLGITLPPSIKACGLEKQFIAMIKETNKFYFALKKVVPLAAPYILTNAHCRRVMMRVNVRELYHISRLREDAHAQWDIQNVSREMTTQAKKIMPKACMLIGGKDRYGEIYKAVFGVSPKIIQAVLPGVRKLVNS